MLESRRKTEQRVDIKCECQKENKEKIGILLERERKEVKKGDVRIRRMKEKK